MSIISQIASTTHPRAVTRYNSHSGRALAIEKMQQYIAQFPAFDRRLGDTVSETATKYDLPGVMVSPVYVRAFYAKQVARLNRVKDRVTPAIFDSWRGCLTDCISNTAAAMDLLAQGKSLR